MFPGFPGTMTKIAHCDLNYCFIHSFTCLMEFPEGFFWPSSKNKTRMRLPLVVGDLYFWTCESSEMIQKIIVDISVTISTVVSDLLKIQPYCQFLYFRSPNTSVSNICSSIYLNRLLPDWWRMEPQCVSRVFIWGWWWFMLSYMFFCLPIHSLSLLFPPLLVVNHTIILLRGNDLIRPYCKTCCFFISPPQHHLLKCALSCIHHLLRPCAVSRLPSGTDWQPSSSCFARFSVCPPPISPSVRGIYAALLQLLRHTSWLLPGEVDWLLSHSRALPASGLTPADAAWGARSRWDGAERCWIQMAFACWQSCH